MLPVLEVAEVVLVAVGFLFEADVAVGLHAVAVLEEQDEPLQEVPEEEGQVEEFLLLDHVDEFVVKLRLAERPDGEDEAEETASQELPAHRMPLNEENLFHLFTFYLFTFSPFHFFTFSPFIRSVGF